MKALLRISVLLKGRELGSPLYIHLHFDAGGGFDLCEMRGFFLFALDQIRGKKQSEGDSDGDEWVTILLFSLQL